MTISTISNKPYQSLPKAALMQMRLISLLWLFFLLLLLIPMYFLLMPVLDALSSQLLTVCLLIIMTLLTILYWFLTAIQYRYTGYHLDEDGFAIRQGMLWRHEVFVLRSRVQHIDITNHPLSRFLGLAKLHVYTAGTKLGSISLDGLSRAEAEYIRDQLITADTDTL